MILQMRTATVLGAGFSKAVADLPLTDELGTEVLRRVPSLRSRAVRGFSDGSFETLMSRMAEPQPDLTDVVNAENRALFTASTVALQQVLLEHEARALTMPIPDWLHSLVRTLHVTQSDVITFNYDTLFERATVSSGCWDHALNVPANTESILLGLPPAPSAFLSSEEVSTLRLMKLHGSLDAFWVRGDTAGSTILRIPGNRRWDSRTASDARHERIAPGREPFIVPPASAKSAFYNNPITRQLWRDAAAALKGADQAALIGYSLPLTDLVTAGMISDCLAPSAKTVHVVNVEPEPVRERLAKLGIARSRTTPHSGVDCVEHFARFLADKEAARQFAVLRGCDANAPLAIFDQSYGMRPVIGVEQTPEGVALRVDLEANMDDLLAAGPRGQARLVRDVLSARNQGLGVGLFLAIEGTDHPVAILDSRPSQAGWVQMFPALPPMVRQGER